MPKQSFVWIVKKKMPNDDSVLYTSQVRHCTLQASHEFHFDGKMCGRWAFNELLTIDFRAGGGMQTFIHVFMKCKRSDCWRLVKKDNAIYNCFAPARHNNENEEIVLLLKVLEEIEIDE